MVSPSSPSPAPVPPAGETIRLIVLFGGMSAEHDVSCTTAAQVLAAVDPARYEIEAVGITRDGTFVRADEAMAALAQGARHLPPSLSPSGPSTELTALVAAPSRAVRTVVLPLLHGPMGEDGTVQGMLDLANVPYVGAGVLGSAVAMDKAMAKTVASAHGIPQARWLWFREHDIAADPKAVMKEVADQLGLPVFVKPANMGSSVGVSKATTETELSAAIQKALVYDELVVIEEAITGREIELSVLGNLEPEVSVPGEIVAGAEFYDYEDKYLDGNAQLIIPAQLPPGVTEELQALAATVYRALRIEGMARVDFFYEENGRGALLNEVNTIPGFTPISMYPKMWEASGLPYAQLIDRLVELAIERHDRRAAKRVTTH